MCPQIQGKYFCERALSRMVKASIFFFSFCFFRAHAIEEALRKDRYSAEKGTGSTKKGEGEQQHKEKTQPSSIFSRILLQNYSLFVATAVVWGVFAMKVTNFRVYAGSEIRTRQNILSTY